MARMGRPLESFARLRDAGVNIGLGTDTWPPDFVENMRQGINMCRIVEQEPAACSAADFCQAATLNAARALRRDDPGLDACRTVATGPVVGICEAAMHMASMIATGFSVVTTLRRAIPVIEHNALRYGFERHCRRVRAADVPVLALEEPGSNARIKIRDEILPAIDEDRCEATVLGCAGMADLTRWLTEATGIPVVDGVVAGVRMVEAIVGAGLRTSKVGGYAAPIPK
jgi:Asp/Glu/hydantoin racemase